MSNEVYPCYVRISEEKGTDDLVELPTEKDGTMLLSTIQAQFPDAIGLRFKSESGAWRGVRSSDKVLDPPLEGWGYNEYYITLPKTAGKRKVDNSAGGPGSKSKKMTEKEMLSDLIVLGLSYDATEEDLKTYFEKYGELDMYEIKFDPATKKSRGFGFIRFKTVEAVEAVLAASPHIMMERKCEVRFPKKDGQDGGPTKLFVGRLPGGTTVDDLKEHFSEYGDITDVYIPTQFRGYGFVTMESQEDAREILTKTHVIKGNYVNVSYPTQKGKQAQQQTQQQSPQQPQSNMGMQQQQYGYSNMQGNMKPNMQSPQSQGPPGPQGYSNQGPPGQGYGNQVKGYSNQGTGYGNPAGGYGNQGGGGGGYGNQANTMNGYYTSGYFQPGGKMQSGKMM